MPDLPRDPLMGSAGPVPLLPGEELLVTFTPDRRIYWQGAATLAAVAAVVVGAVLLAMGNANVLVGGIGAVAAIGLRAWYIASEVLGFAWRLTDRRLLGPGGRVVPLVRLVRVRRILTDVQIVTDTGDKHLIRNVAGPDAVVATITAARDRAIAPDS